MAEPTLRFGSTDGRFAVHLSRPLALALAKMSLAAGSRETGGILAGYYSTDERTAVVTEISPPPADSNYGFSVPLVFRSKARRAGNGHSLVKRCNAAAGHQGSARRVSL
ncbi:MAG: hypothetical protein U9Q81_08600, partial [Pseudomonadota bacterium]|nr:hypothetical protein [Pseudomonadota bacterium]